MTDSNSNIKRPRVKDTKAFIKAARMVHGERYNYDTVKYIKSVLRVKITCKAHGVFEQKPHNHLKGANCPKCGCNNRNKYYDSIRKSAAKEFKERACRRHGESYDYSMVDYKTSNIKVKIICANHGVFTQTPYEHLSGKGCYKCARERIRKAIQGRAIEAASIFEVKARSAHSDKYNYQEVRYKNNTTKVDIICPHHGLFAQTPRSHLSGKGCPDCGREIASGWSRSQFVEYANEVNDGIATVYIIKCWNESETFYKIGVTTQNVKKRFNSNKSMPYEFEVIKTKKSKAETVYDTEIQLHRMNKENHYTPKIRFGGSVLECFTKISQDALFLLDAI